MNISSLINKTKEIANSVKTVRSSYDGDVYSIWNTGEIKYASFVVAITSVVREDNLRNYNLVLYYGDRLMSSGKNKNSIWDDATNTLQTVINKLCDNLDAEVNEYTITCFEQKFEDYLAGAYTNITLSIEDELGECEINDVILEEDSLIERLKEAILEYQDDNEQLALLLKQILFKLNGEVVQ